jgi:hypothetical protein
MGVINLSTVFSGGVGTLDIISYDTGQKLSFTQNSLVSQSMTLPQGSQIFSISGVSPAGVGGNISLSITGDIPAQITQSFLSGNIPPHSLILYITI